MALTLLSNKNNTTFRQQTNKITDIKELWKMDDTRKG